MPVEVNIIKEPYHCAEFQFTGLTVIWTARSVNDATGAIKAAVAFGCTPLQSPAFPYSIMGRMIERGKTQTAKVRLVTVRLGDWGTTISVVDPLITKLESTLPGAKFRFTKVVISFL
jgi:hypothetical protein